MSIGLHEPFWIEAPDRRLYAAWHPAASSRVAAGVLMVPPLLHEQARSRRFITEVASQLASLGFPCLRFDFAGTGDSSGTGDALDFASMRRDIDLAAAALRSMSGIQQVVVVAWRAAALVTQSWLHQGRDVRLVVLWEPIVDGRVWLTGIEREDAQERACRPRPRPGVTRTDTSGDGQLMGCPASPQLRLDLANSILGRSVGAALRPQPTWAVLRGDAPDLPFEVDHVQSLPATACTFGSGASMEATFFLAPLLERMVDEMGLALIERLSRAPTVEMTERSFP